MLFNDFRFFLFLLLFFIIYFSSEKIITLLASCIFYIFWNSKFTFLLSWPTINDFFVFLVLSFITYLSSRQLFKKFFLLFTSYIFYAFWDWRFTLLLLWSTIIDFYCGKIMPHSSNKKTILWFSIINNLGILAFFKYFNFFIESFINLSHALGLEASPYTLQIILPVGISFYTFQTMSYTIDVYREKMKPTDNLLDFSIFVSFFPQLVAGPIERASKLLPQIEKLEKATKEKMIAGCILIFMGYVRKVLISDNIGPIVDNYFDNYATLDSIYLLTGLILFSFQIYFDFSGYSSIARGIAKILGIDLMINFNQPYFSQNISEFWTRWHISLSTWLRDYVYIPLGGSRNGETRTYINLMATMLIGGLWHGSSWNFVFWGALHGSYLVIHKLITGNKKQETSFSFTSISNMFFVYCLVLITWLPFRANDFDITQAFFYKILFWVGPVDIESIKLIAILFTALVIIDLPAYITKSHTFLLKLPGWLLSVVLFVGIVAILIVMIINIDSVQPFIYFQF